MINFMRQLACHAFVKENARILNENQAREIAEHEARVRAFTHRTPQL